jgi:Conserved mid region of cactin
MISSRTISLNIFKQVYRELEHGQNSDFWQDITVIVQDELHKLRKMEGLEDTSILWRKSHSRLCLIQINVLAFGRRDGIHQSVAKEVAGIFKGKSAEQLAGIQKQIETTISQRAEGVDIGYWESLLSQLKGNLKLRLIL